MVKDTHQKSQKPKNTNVSKKHTKALHNLKKPYILKIMMDINPQKLIKPGTPEEKRLASISDALLNVDNPFAVLDEIQRTSTSDSLRLSAASILARFVTDHHKNQTTNNSPIVLNTISLDENSLPPELLKLIKSKQEGQ